MGGEALYIICNSVRDIYVGIDTNVAICSCFFFFSLLFLLSAMFGSLCYKKCKLHAVEDFVFNLAFFYVLFSMLI